MHKATEFFKYGILPELLGRWYTTLQSTASNMDVNRDAERALVDTTNTSMPTTTEKRYCYCKEEKDGLFIFCDGENCSIEWFHVECLKIKRIPKGKWFCPDCRKIKRASKGN